MTFEDTLKVRTLTYPDNVVVVGNTAYLTDKNGELTSEVVTGNDYKYDANGDAIEPSIAYADFAKCFISFNSSAQSIRLNDGSEYRYAYYVIAPLKKALYPIIPREGQLVKIKKADGTINAEMEVRGFVTYKKRYLKIWL